MTYPRYFNARIETMPLKQVQELQERKLRKQLAYNYQNSAFYRQKFDQVGLRPEDIRTLEDLVRLPFTTKEELRDSQIEHPPLGLHAAVPMAGYHYTTRLRRLEPRLSPLAREHRID